LSGRASRALGWSFGSTVLTKFSLFGIGIMLARLLGPHAFGTYAVAYVALIAVLNFNELGVSLAIVRWPGDPAEIIPTVTTISLITSVVIYVGCFLAAPAYAHAMGAPAATTVVRVLALAVLSDGLTNTPAAVLQRNFRQGQRTICDQVNVWLGTGVTIILAWSGAGAMSLAVGRLVGGAAGALLLVIFAPESLRVGFDRAKARALLRFGLPLAGASFLTFGVASVDQVIVGRVLGPVELGFYVLALNLAGWPVAMFYQPIRTVGPAVFSRLQHEPSAMRTTFVSAAGLLGAVALPVCLVIAGAARPLISFVYGAHWVPAVGALPWLAALCGLQVFFLIAYDYLVVLGRSRFLLVTQLTWLLVLIPALAVGATAAGIAGAGLGEFAVAAFCILPWYLVELRRGGIRLGALGRRAGLPLAGATVAGLLAAGLAKVAPDELVALVGSGVTTVAVVGLLLHRMRATLALLRSAVTTAGSPEAEQLKAEQERAPGAAAGPGDAVARNGSPHAAPRRSALPGPGVTSEPGPAPGTGAGGDFMAAPTHGVDIRTIPHSAQDLSLTSPLYRITVAARHWDPGAANASPRAIVPGRTGSALAFARQVGPSLTAEGAQLRPDLVQEDTPS
jgi:O-antigen/teichoic acid export membrane protein